MAENSAIEWTDATWSPVTGCKAISPGCANCFAARLAATRLRNHPAYRGLAKITSGSRAVWSGEVRLHQDRLEQPLRWRKGKHIFVCDMSDLFHEDVPDEFIDEVFGVMGACEDSGIQHTFQVLTKRADRLAEYMCNRGHRAWNSRRLGTEAYPPRNVWLGVSCEDQTSADERIPLLLRASAAVRFLSIEPLLGPVRLHGFGEQVNPVTGVKSPRRDGAFWVIIGGESGAYARPCQVEWIRSLVEECKAAGLPCFVKQLGSSPEYETRITGAGGIKPTGRTLGLELRHSKGADMDEWPADLRVRQFPEVAHG